MKIFFQILLLLIITLQATCIADETNAKKYSFLDQDSKERNEYTALELQRFIRSLGGDPNWPKIQHFLLHNEKLLSRLTQTDDNDSKDTTITILKDRLISANLIIKKSKIKKEIDVKKIGIDLIRQRIAVFAANPNKTIIAFVTANQGSSDDRSLVFFDLVTEKRMNLTDHVLPTTDYELEWSDNSTLNVKANDESEIYSFSQENSFNLKTTTPYIKPNDEELFQISIENKGTFKTLEITDKNGNELTTFNSTGTLSFSDTVTQKENIVTIRFMGLSCNTQISWKPKSQRLEDLIPAECKQEDKTLKVKYMYVQSMDGTSVPIKLFYNPNTPLRDRPVLLTTYGGFQVNYLDDYSALSVMERQFVRDGGVFVVTGVRGGSEFGPYWHDNVMNEKKYKTFEDLACVANWLIALGITKKEKIVSTGTSNGAFVVAAAALLYPEYFGLVIPTAGVLDMLSKDKLDQRFKGFSKEYGSSLLESDITFLKKFSPLENSNFASKGPEFLIVSGENDSRVNPAHSIKFAKALSELPETKYHLVVVKNEGHGVENNHTGASFQYNVLLWTKIYSFLKMKFNNR